MLPATKEQPKEMLPVPILTSKYGLVFKPFLQLIYEQLYDVGIRTFIFVVGRGKRSIEDHFTPDWSYVEYLESKGKKREAEILKDFYRRLEKSVIIWVNQPQPLGFGDAVERAAQLVKGSYVVHAGDITFRDPKNSEPIHLKELIKVYNNRKPDALIMLHRVPDPHHYGIAEVEEIEGNVYKVIRVMEKPSKPPTNLAIAAIYIFNDMLLEALKKTPPRPYGEKELTDAIQRLIDEGTRVEAIVVDNALFIDIGRPETYINAINTLASMELSV
jgi:UTP--glucose-1-phosphate uridylyltransferase